jgi:hypothetical protein
MTGAAMPSQALVHVLPATQDTGTPAVLASNEVSEGTGEAALVENGSVPMSLDLSNHDLKGGNAGSFSVCGTNAQSPSTFVAGAKVAVAELYASGTYAFRNLFGFTGAEAWMWAPNGNQIAMIGGDGAVEQFLASGTVGSYGVWRQYPQFYGAPRDATYDVFSTNQQRPVFTAYAQTDPPLGDPTIADCSRVVLDPRNRCQSYHYDATAAACR